MARRHCCNLGNPDVSKGHGSTYPIVPATQRMEWSIPSVYALTNEGMPGLVKVGFTDGCPYVRARQLSNATGVPHPFEVAWARECYAPRTVEFDVHQRLARYRVNRRREFFACPHKHLRLDEQTRWMLNKARNEIEMAADGFLRRQYKARRRNRYRHWRKTMRYMLLAAAVLGLLAVIARPHWTLSTAVWATEKAMWVVIDVARLVGHHHGY
jgi:T5orf172 domain